MYRGKQEAGRDCWKVYRGDRNWKGLLKGVQGETKGWKRLKGAGKGCRKLEDPGKRLEKRL